MFKKLKKFDIIPLQHFLPVGLLGPKKLKNPKSNLAG